MGLSVIIPTYNRKHEIERSMSSALRLKAFIDEVIVVDDCSTDGTSEYIKEHFPQVSLYRLNENSGVCVARNYGISKCSSQYAVFLDSDDELLPDAAKTIYEQIESYHGENKDPAVFFFLMDKAKISDETLDHINQEKIIKQAVSGNAATVINIPSFLSKKYTYPEDVSKVGGEHLLWLRICRNENIPIFNKAISIEHDDAQNRLTSPDTQVNKAKYHAILQEQTIIEFGNLYKRYNINDYFLRLNACSIYWKLAGNMKPALKWAFVGLRNKLSLRNFQALLFAFLPGGLAKKVFKAWRKSS